MTDQLVTAVRETCILATIRTRALGTTRTDRQASDEVTQNKGATRDAARVVVSRLAGADELHKKIVSTQNEMKNVLVMLSMPYPDEGWRILPNANFERFLQTGMPIKRKFDGLVQELAVKAQDVIDAARRNAGNFNVAIPTVEELTSAYEMFSDFREVPEGNFRNVPEQAARKLQALTERRLAAAIQDALTSTMERFLDPLDRFVERMTAFDEREAAAAQGKDVGRNGVFRDTVVTNIRELVDVVGSLNVTGDLRLEALKARLTPVVTLEPDALRDNAEKRAKAKAQVQEVLDDLRGWLTPAA